MASNDSENRERETVGARLDQEVVERIDGYADELDTSRSDAMRKLIKKGIIQEQTTGRRDLTDIFVTFMAGLFGTSMALTYGIRAVAIAALGGLLLASFAAALKYGRYDIRITLLNREKADLDAADTALSISTEPDRKESEPA